MPRRSSSRYLPATGSEGQPQPGSRGRVLHNKPGIIQKRELDRVEFTALVRTQTAWLERITPATRFTPEILCAMHHDWLSELYEWAGRYRTVELEKGGFRWPPAYRVAENMSTFEKGLLATHTPCQPAPLLEVARRIAAVHAEFLLIHPFRDGNGRIARWLADLMTLQAGYPLPSYGFTGRGASARRQYYLAAVSRGYVMDYAALTDFFAEAIERRLREA